MFLKFQIGEGLGACRNDVTCVCAQSLVLSRTATHKIVHSTNQAACEALISDYGILPVYIVIAESAEQEKTNHRML